ncbi:MAG TPA: GNAT family N-acetyltransferase [Trebonia sp.]|nr:GNAT family N-acetyltransferase [Trebonia sp.]
MQTIIELERMAAAHWRGTEERWLGDWLLRAAEGFTGRANSVLPLGDPGLPLDEALAAVTGWYRARGLPPMIVVPSAADTESAGQSLDEQLSARNWAPRPGPAFVMVADLPLAGLRPDSLPADRKVRVTSEPGDAWAAMYHYRGQDHLPPIARTVLTSAAAQSFVSITSGDELLAIARLSVAGGWAGITAVEVNAAYRRQGLGTAITAAACQEAARHGVGRVFLQVEVTNTAARALYESLGFRYSHRYHYRVAPS